jgi:hypothetical protein
MIGERQARVCGARIGRAGRDAIEFQRRNEVGTAYLLMWTLGLPLGMILLWPPDSLTMVSGVLGVMLGLPLAAILLCRSAPLAGVARMRAAATALATRRGVARRDARTLGAERPRPA